MAPPPTSNPAPPPEPPSLPVQDELLQEISLPTTVMAPSSQQIPPPAPSVADLPDVLLEDIFLRLPAAADLARASTARASFRRVIKDHAFLRRYRALHPPPLVGVIEDAFIPAQPPHPSAVAARAFAGFDFSCSSFLPSTAGRPWRAIDFFDGRALLTGGPARRKCGIPQLDFHYGNFLVRDLAVCDPVHRRYVLLPAVPGDLKALVREPELLHLDTFLAPSTDEEDPLSFRVICLVQCRMHILLLVFSSLDGQWHSLAFDCQATFDSYEDPEGRLSDRQFLHGCFFCWRLRPLNKVLLLDMHTMELSSVNPPPEQGADSSFVIVEAAQGMLGMLTRGNDRDNQAGPFWLTYSILRNNQWHPEKVIPLPVKYAATLLGAAGGYLLIEALFTTSSEENLQFGFFSVDVKTFQVDLFAEHSKMILPAQLYAGFPPSLCAPTI